MKYLLLLLAATLPVSAQQAAPGVEHPDAKRPTFEVASVKLNPRCTRALHRYEYSPGRLHISCVTVRSMLTEAYFLGTGRQHSEAIRIVGGPGWLDTDRFDISAKAEGPAGETEMKGPMMLALLEDRFHLSLRKDYRDVPVFELIVTNGGPKLRLAQEGSCVTRDSRTAPPGDPGKAGAGRVRKCGYVGDRSAGVLIVAEWNSVTLGYFADMLRGRTNRLVLDRTGLTGQYDIRLELSPSDLTSGPRFLNGQPESPRAQSDPSGGPTIFEALPKQLGLKLVPATARQAVFVVDHAERPLPN
jgi:uncharacterized protein (TIGR03435 family)